MLFLKMPCLVVRSGPSKSPRAELSQLVEGDLEPTYPIVITFPASPEAIDALLGTKRGLPRIVPDETNLPSQTEHRVALLCLRLSEKLGIVVSSWFYRSSSSIILFPLSHLASLCAFPTDAT